MNLPLSLIIEALVAVLLVITIGYCMLLNGRLKRLRADEEGLRATIAELLTATEIAERAIQGLRSTSAQCDQSLGKRLQEAAIVDNELSTKMTAAEAVIQRIGKLASATGVPQAARVAPVQPVAQQQVVAPNAAASQAHAHAHAQAPSRRLDDAARALQSRLQRVAS